MIRIEVAGNKERQFLVALMFAGLLLDGRSRHGMVKHVRDNRRAWRRRAAR